MRMRNSQGMDHDSSFFLNNCRDISSSLSTKLITETSKAVRAPYPCTNKKQIKQK